MKACMSDREGRRFHEDIHIVCDASVAEARRILAETEPRIPDACTAHYAPEWGCYLPDRIGAGEPCNPWDFTAALAESLAAFVAE